jgi:hypothetical protein
VRPRKITPIDQALAGERTKALRNLESIQAARAMRPPGNSALRRGESAVLPQHYGPVLGRNFPLKKRKKESFDSCLSG